MSPYRTPWAFETPPPGRAPSTFGFAIAFAAMGVAGVLAQCRLAYRLDELEAQIAALQASDDARELAERNDAMAERRRAVEWRTPQVDTRHVGLDNEQKSMLPKCVCAPGDPLCSEIPGQTCE